MISTTVSPGSGSSGVPQSVLEAGAAAGVADRPIVGEDHRDQAGVGGPLDVVLAAQRVQPGAGPADLAADQRQRDQAAGVVGAVDVLRDAHAPEDHRRLRPGVDPRHLAQGRRRRCRRSAPSPRAGRPPARSRSALEALGVPLDVLRGRRAPRSMITWIRALSSATSVPGPELPACGWRAGSAPGRAGP